MDIISEATIFGNNPMTWHLISTLLVIDQLANRILNYNKNRIETIVGLKYRSWRKTCTGFSAVRSVCFLKAYLQKMTCLARPSLDLRRSVSAAVRYAGQLKNYNKQYLPGNHSGIFHITRSEIGEISA